MTPPTRHRMKMKIEHTPSELAALRIKERLAFRVCLRAEANLGFDPKKRTSLLMDLESLDLDLGRLLAFPPFDFAHDIHGIRRHMDRSEFPGKLTDCFVPRCSHNENEGTTNANPK